MEKVIFRKYSDGTIIALFPEHASDEAGMYCSSYVDVGGHSGADYWHVINATRPATPEEYASMKQTLERSYGYELEVRQRASQEMHESRRTEFH